LYTRHTAQHMTFSAFWQSAVSLTRDVRRTRHLFGARACCFRQQYSWVARLGISHYVYEDCCEKQHYCCVSMGVMRASVPNRTAAHGMRHGWHSQTCACRCGCAARCPVQPLLPLQRYLSAWQSIRLTRKARFRTCHDEHHCFSSTTAHTHTLLEDCASMLTLLTSHTPPAVVLACNSI
jgi:hypothetical protein